MARDGGLEREDPRRGRRRPLQLPLDDAACSAKVISLGSIGELPVRFRLFVALASLFASTASPATWHQASSPHFLIYADMPAARLQEFATKLEKFDKAVRVARNSPEMPKSDGNRLTLFVVSSQSALRRLVQDKTGWVAGMYQGRASGSIAFVPRSAGTGELDLSAEAIFFHEYAHHLMFQNLATPVPEWLSEGFAEFMSTAKVERDGSVTLGIPPNIVPLGCSPPPLSRSSACSPEIMGNSGMKPGSPFMVVAGS